MVYASDPQRYAKEVEGAMGDDEVPTFTEPWVDGFLGAKAIATRDVPFLFLSVDPAAGGRGSDTAWTTHFFDTADRIVVRAAATAAG